MDANYDIDKIQVLEGLEAVRKRPSMYIGDTHIQGLHHLVYEAVDNSIDEALVGACKNINVDINQDGSITVEDDGRGIPVDIHPVHKKTGVELVMTTLHAGGKFDDKSYRISGGLHGVGISVVNGLSQWLEIEVSRDGKVYCQKFKEGIPTTNLEVIGTTTRTGTKVRFKPDKEIFKQTQEFSFDMLSQRLRELAFLNKGLTISISEERSKKKHTFLYQGGIISFVEYLNENKTPLHDKPIYFSKEKDGTEVEIAIQYNDGYQENIFSYANTINTHEGGSHLSGFKSGLTRVLNDYAKKNNLIKEVNFSLSGEDMREGITAVISVKLREPQFEGQTKTKLGNSEVKGIVESIVGEGLDQFCEENPIIAKKIIEKSIMAARAREAARNQTQKCTGDRLTTR